MRTLQSIFSNVLNKDLFTRSNDTNCFLYLYGKTKPSSAVHSPPLRVGLHFALSGFISPLRPRKQLKFVGLTIVMVLIILTRLVLVWKYAMGPYFNYVRKKMRFFDPLRFQTIEKVLKNNRRKHKFEDFRTLPPSKSAYVIKVWSRL